MKNMKYLVAAASAVALMTLSGAGTAQAATLMDGTSHNLSGLATVTGGTEVCVFCHTPHNASATAKPLWNRTAAAATYTMYTSTTLQGTPSTSGQPEGVSAACLSCHDGATAYESLINPGSMTFSGTTTMAGTRAIGEVSAGNGDLSNDHPISIDVPLPAADPGLELAATIRGAGLPLYTGTGGSDQVECGTCHDPHSTAVNFLRIANDGSALCTTCHKK